ncbi:hypothetical protein NDU88_002143 [Pleurodeles waltl]|uniref:Uncharacterized protein n=1 Tax=Pleurodeles waltl TaxID=8319 RepID=A0AAV7MQJ3_PLEWA|nr:hypothetical protein NDU88_002143 [Pleurodeles waltl]
MAFRKDKRLTKGGQKGAKNINRPKPQKTKSGFPSATIVPVSRESGDKAQSRCWASRQGLGGEQEDLRRGCRESHRLYTLEERRSEAGCIFVPQLGKKR